MPIHYKNLITETGSFRTNWLDASYVTPAVGLTEDYKNGPVGQMLLKCPTMYGLQEGDPHKAAKGIIEVVTGTAMRANETIGSCLRLPLGNDAMDKARDKVSTPTHNLDAVEQIARSTTYNDG